MRLIRKTFAALALAVLVTGPALAAPAVSAHASTLSAPTPAPASTPWRIPLTLAAMVGVAMTVKDSASSAAKFVTRAGAASQDYTNGVSNAGPKWQAAAAASEPNYVQGVQAAASRGAYGKGIAKHGSTKYQNNATKLGAQRYGPGVQNAQAAYQAGVDPFLQALKGADLPARGPKGSPQNQARANAVAVLLRKLKTGGQ